MIDLEDMLQNVTVISDTMIEKPNSFYAACKVTTQSGIESEGAPSVPGTGKEDISEENHLVLFRIHLGGADRPGKCPLPQ